MARVEVTIPRLFRPRTYQAEFVQAMRAGYRRAALVWHRRAGKDACTLNWTIEAMVQRPGSYYYFFPTYKQGKRILWRGIQADGRPFLEHFPPELVLDKNETDMTVTLAVPGGGHSIFQILGADEVDKSSIGTNPVGCVFSEYSLMNPGAWDLVRPILAENRGWAVFVYTPRGKNWGHKLWQYAQSAGGWFTSLKTVDDTRRDGADEGDRRGEPVVAPAAIDAERAAGMPEELIQQEFYCSFTGAIAGTYYGDLVARAEDEGRVGTFPWDPSYPVDTAWDLGIDDETVIGFTQTIDRAPTWIDYYAHSGAGLEHYADVLKARPYTYRHHYGPHDLSVREWGAGQARLHQARRLGLNFRVVPKHRLEDGIQAARRLLTIARFDAERCARLLDVLRAYHREFDDQLQTWLPRPVHDWSSHGADMVRYRAYAWHEAQEGVRGGGVSWFSPFGTEHTTGPRPGRVQHDFDPWRA